MSRVRSKPLQMIAEFIRLESSAGILLVAMAIFALILDNSPLSSYYQLLLSTHFSFHLGRLGLDKPVIAWINEGLMTIFFFLVGLEIKRELQIGELSSFKKAILPVIAALGGMLVPALIYISFNQNNATTLRGWAIPTATDIAFALGILTLLKSRIPPSIKVFLTALAILDDLGAILIIAIFYSTDLSIVAFQVAIFCFIMMIILNRFRVMSIIPYMLIGFILWVAVLKSGVHATLAGVLIALCIPLQDPNNPKISPLRMLEYTLHPWVAYGVLPIFAFANAGVSFDGLKLSDLTSQVPLGIAAGLFFGKQAGVFTASFVCVKSRIASLPTHANWRLLYGTSLLCGVGFTMSLFIGSLAFSAADPVYLSLVRLGVLTGSCFSGVIGYFVLSRL